MEELITQTHIVTRPLLQTPLGPRNLLSISMDLRSKAVEDCWYQVIIPDPHCLDGQSVGDFMKFIGTRFAITCVLVDDVIGVAELQGIDGTMLPWGEFLKQVINAKQYDWAWFFLYCNGEPIDYGALSEPLTLIARSDVTVRLVDDSYFYVYTCSKTLSEDLIAEYRDRDCRLITASLYELEIPF